MSEILIDQEFFSAARRGLKSYSDQEVSDLKVAVESALTDEGAFKGESGEADIYMTSFGIQLMTLLKIDKTATATTAYLQSLRHGAGLGFLHIVSLCRAWRFYRHASLEAEYFDRLAEKLEFNRCADGAWNQAAGTHFSSVYGTFLAIAAYQDLDLTIPEEAKITAALRGLKSSDGAYGTDQGADDSTTPATAFASLVLAYMEEPYDFCISWLEKQQHSDGGFLALSKMPFSDLQSTVYALMALKACAPSVLKEVSPAAEKFLLSLKCEVGFKAHCKDESCTAENTFLGLAGLGLIHK